MRFSLLSARKSTKPNEVRLPLGNSGRDTEETFEYLYYGSQSCMISLVVDATARTDARDLYPRLSHHPACFPPFLVFSFGSLRRIRLTIPVLNSSPRAYNQVDGRVFSRGLRARIR